MLKSGLPARVASLRKPSVSDEVGRAKSSISGPSPLPNSSTPNSRFGIDAINDSRKEAERVNRNKGQRHLGSLECAGRAQRRRRFSPSHDQSCVAPASRTSQMPDIQARSCPIVLSRRGGARHDSGPQKPTPRVSNAPSSRARLRPPRVSNPQGADAPARQQGRPCPSSISSRRLRSPCVSRAIHKVE